MCQGNGDHIHADFISLSVQWAPLSAQYRPLLLKRFLPFCEGKDGASVEDERKWHIVKENQVTSSVLDFICLFLSFVGK